MAIYASDPVNNVARFASLQKQNVMSKKDIDAVMVNHGQFFSWVISKIESRILVLLFSHLNTLKLKYNFSYCYMV